jgi:hypothetical protein
MQNKKPNFPSDFPSDLKELVFKGWSKEPNERPALQYFMAALNNMLKGEETQSNGFSGCFVLL